MTEKTEKRAKRRRRVPESVRNFGDNWVDAKDSDINDFIIVCLDNESLLNQWEADFLDSVSDQLERTNGLTRKQYDALEEIVDRLSERTVRC